MYVVSAEMDWFWLEGIRISMSLSVQMTLTDTEVYIEENHKAIK